MPRLFQVVTTSSASSLSTDREVMNPWRVSPRWVSFATCARSMPRSGRRDDVDGPGEGAVFVGSGFHGWVLRFGRHGKNPGGRR